MKNISKVMFLIAIFCFAMEGLAQDKNIIAQGISIRNFQVDNMSDAEIKVTIDYSYFGKTGPDFVISAFPRTSKGNTLSKNMKMQQIPLKSGRHQISIMMAKRPKIKNFRSNSIRVCMFNKTAKPYIFCEEFLFSKSWRDAKLVREPEPEIVSFKIQPQIINKGDRVRFYWEVKNAKKVQLFDSYSEIKTAIELPNGALGWPHMLNGSYMENLNKSETYRLKVTSHLGRVENKIVKVTVKGKKID
jgi:hypothetical protein